MVLRPDWSYRLSLRMKFGAGRLVEFPAQPLPNGVLQSEKEWREVDELARRMHIPRHRSPEKNWDHLAAVFAILANTSPSAAILDAGAELYSNVLPALFAYGYHDLTGINLSFTGVACRGPIRYLRGDITRTEFPDNSFDAVACMSVIEHGVPLEPYLREMFRILKPSALLITSTDFFETPIDTQGKMAHEAPIKIFTRPEIEQILSLAEGIGFERTGPIDLACREKAIHWTQVDLDYTFVLFTLRKPAKV